MRLSSLRHNNLSGEQSVLAREQILFRRIKRGSNLFSGDSLRISDKIGTFPSHSFNTIHISFRITPWLFFFNRVSPLSGDIKASAPPIAEHLHPVVWPRAWIAGFFLVHFTDDTRNAQPRMPADQKQTASFNAIFKTFCVKVTVCRSTFHTKLRQEIE